MTQVVAVQTDVENPEPRIDAGNLAHQLLQAPRQRHSAGADAHEHHLVDGAIALHHLVGQSRQAARQVGRIENAALGVPALLLNHGQLRPAARAKKNLRLPPSTRNRRQHRVRHCAGRRFPGPFDCFKSSCVRIESKRSPLPASRDRFKGWMHRIPTPAHASTARRPAHAAHAPAPAPGAAARPVRKRQHTLPESVDRSMLKATFRPGAPGPKETTHGTEDQPRGAQFRRRNDPGSDQFPRMDRRRLGHPVFPPQGLHAGVHHRAGDRGRAAG